MLRQASIFQIIPASRYARSVFMILCGFLLSSQVLGQFGNNWAYSHQIGIDFNEEPPRLYHTKCDNYLGLPATLSDSIGNVLLYFDGTRLFNGDHKEILGNEPLLPSRLNEMFYRSGSALFPSSLHAGVYYLVYLMAPRHPVDSIKLIYSSIAKINENLEFISLNNILVSKAAHEMINFELYYNRTNLNLFAIRYILEKNNKVGGYHYDSIEHLQLSENSLNIGLNLISDGTFYIGSLPENYTETKNTTSYTTSNRISVFGKHLFQRIGFSNNSFPNLDKFYIRICDLNDLHNIKCKLIDSVRTMDFLNNCNTIEFQPFDLQSSYSENFLFYSSIKIRDFGLNEYDIFQYDINTGKRYRLFNLNVIDKNKVHENNRWTSPRFKLAPNGNILIAGYRHLFDNFTSYPGRVNMAAILSPDTFGPGCNFVEFYPITFTNSNIDITSNTHLSNIFYGFPNTIPDYIPLKFKWHSHECSDSVWFINLSRNPGFTKFTWFFTPNDSLEIESYDSVAFAFPRSGPYTVRVKGRTRKGGHQWRSEDMVFIKQPKALFEVEPNEGCQYIAYALRNTSLNDTLMPGHTLRHYWDFGDGHDTIIDYGSQVQVRDTIYHAYNRSGAFDVRLIIDNGFCRDTFTRRQEVYIRPAPMPGFDLNPATGCAPQQITAYSHGDTVVRQRYQWGNGQQSEEWYNPPGIPAPPVQHTYTRGGTYTITQELEGPSGCITTATRTLHLREGIDTSMQIPVALADIAAPNTAEIHWQSVPGAVMYHLSRTGVSDGFKKNIASTRDTSFTDKDINTQKQAYRYLLQAADSCGRRAQEGLPGTTLLLQGERQADENMALLSYSAYETWPGGVQRYHIQYRDRQGQWQHLGTSQTLRYTDLDFIDTTLILKCYRVVAESVTGLMSHSNEICLDYPPRLWVPTAFSPNGDGLNSRFSAIGLGIKEMTLTIYNRNGEEIFRATGEQPEWDGSYRGLPAPQGAYLVMIRARATNNRVINYNGNVTLLR